MENDEASVDLALLTMADLQKATKKLKVIDIVRHVRQLGFGLSIGEKSFQNELLKEIKTLDDIKGEPRNAILLFFRSLGAANANAVSDEMLFGLMSQAQEIVAFVPTLGAQFVLALEQFAKPESRHIMIIGPTELDNVSKLLKGSNLPISELYVIDEPIQALDFCVMKTEDNQWEGFTLEMSLQNHSRWKRGTASWWVRLRLDDLRLNYERITADDGQLSLSMSA